MKDNTQCKVGVGISQSIWSHSAVTIIFSNYAAALICLFFIIFCYCGSRDTEVQLGNKRPSLSEFGNSQLDFVNPNKHPVVCRSHTNLASYTIHLSLTIITLLCQPQQTMAALYQQNKLTAKKKKKERKKSCCRGFGVLTFISQAHLNDSAVKPPGGSGGL